VLILEGVLVIGRGFALGDVEPAHHQLPVGRRAVKQQRQTSPGDPFKPLLLLGLGQVEHAHVGLLRVILRVISERRDGRTSGALACLPKGCGLLLTP
jgi:hypothetical protein